MKICKVCKQEKDYIAFPKWKKGENTCYACHNARRTEQRRARGIKNRESVTEYMREYRIKNRDLLIENQIKSRQSRPLSALWRQVSKRANGFISKEDFMKLEVPTVCPVLGIPISYTMSRDNIPSVDRIDPNLPYELGNIAVISYRANMIKSVGSADEHEKIAQWLRGFGEFKGKPLGGKIVPVGSRILRFGREQKEIGGTVRLKTATAVKSKSLRSENHLSV